MPHREYQAEVLLVGTPFLAASHLQAVVVVDVGTAALAALLEAMVVLAVVVEQLTLLEDLAQADKETLVEQHRQHHPAVVVVLVLLVEILL
jgi:hypothetical protein